MHQEVHSELGSLEEFSIVRNKYIARLKKLREVNNIELKLVPISVQPPSGVLMQECFDAVRGALLQEDVIFINHGNCVEVIPKGITKDKGIKFIAERSNVDLSDILYIGDGINDIEAMNAVGYVACPHNATQEIKAIVKGKNGYISQHNYASGMIEILGHYFG